jgi:hypothetical protein
LARYLTDPRPENLILKCSIKNRSGDWAWADIDPLNWKFILGLYNNEVGVFEKRVIDTAGDFGFLHGKVHLTVKYMVQDRSQWSGVWAPGSYDAMVGYPAIDRPRDFTVSIS